MAASSVLAQPMVPAPYLCVVHQNLTVFDTHYPCPLGVLPSVYQVFLPALDWHCFVASLVHTPTV